MYKAKKPLDLGFADFRSVHQRRRACLRELDLNSRLAPDVYREVLQVSDLQGYPRDYLLQMRRLPSQRSLAMMVGAGADVGDAVRQIARVIASFHSRAETSAEISAAASPGALAERWTSVLATARGARCSEPAGTSLDIIEASARRFLQGRSALLNDRIAAGLVKDAHGDLLAQDIYMLDDGPRVLDCLDFDDQLRHVDVLDDVAFLAMDLEHLGRPDLAVLFIGEYLEFGGTPDSHSLLHHYIAYRATVRAAVSAVGARQGLPGMSADVRAFMMQAGRHLRESAVRLVLVGGPPGTGKSTLSRSLADSLGYVLLSSDRVRRELTDLGDHRYGLDAKSRVYDELLRRVGVCLAHGESVILDATWGRAVDRDQARSAAAAGFSDLVEIRCDLALATARERVRERTRWSGAESEADEQVTIELTRRFEPWPAASVIDTAASPESTLARGLDVVRGVEHEAEAGST